MLSMISDGKFHHEDFGSSIPFHIWKSSRNGAAQAKLRRDMFSLDVKLP
jgi:hypothetical protein